MSASGKGVMFESAADEEPRVESRFPDSGYKREEIKLMKEKPSEGKKLEVAEAIGGGSRKRVLKKVTKVVKKTVGKPKHPALKMDDSDKAEYGVKEGKVENQCTSITNETALNSGTTVDSEKIEVLTKPAAENDEESSGKGKRFFIDLEQPAVEDPDDEVCFVSEEGSTVPDPSCRNLGVLRETKEMESSIILHNSGKIAMHDIDDKCTDPEKAEVCQEVRLVEGVAKHEPNEINYDGYGDCVDYDDHGEDDLAEEVSECPEEPAPEAVTLEEERRELAAVAEDRKSKKEYEIFVGGLDRDATEDDVKRVFESVGEVDEVRLHKDLLTNKNKGYAFVKFANKEHVKRALFEMKNPVIRGKRCGTAPSEDNDTLFLGNICNTWTKEAIRQKLKDYGVDGIENITLVPDAQHEGRSRGFAFIEFSCHAEAMLAYKRLQKPDVVFGHAERTAKVAFAEPIREPDPEVMAQVKTVFLDGLPPHWDEDQVKEQLKGNGDIVRVVLARNMSTAKRKDFGFVDFATHNAAVACIELLNDAEIGDGISKRRIRARLSNPLPKTQAVKGGMSGGFRIGHTGNGPYQRFGRGFSRGGHHGSWTTFPRDTGYPYGRGQGSRCSPIDFGYEDRYMAFRGRNVGRGGRRGNLRDTYHPNSRNAPVAAGPSRFENDRLWYSAPERVPGDHMPYARPPFLPDGGFDRPFAGRHIDDPYYYDDGSRGMKRPLYYSDHHVDYAEPSRMRPRLDYSDPAASFHRPHYHDYGRGGVPYSRDYYGSDYGGCPPFYGNGRPYGRGYYY